MIGAGTGDVVATGAVEGTTGAVDAAGASSGMSSTMVGASWAPAAVVWSAAIAAIAMGALAIKWRVFVMTIKRASFRHSSDERPFRKLYLPDLHRIIESVSRLSADQSRRTERPSA